MRSSSNKSLDNIDDRRQDVLDQLFNCIFKAFDALCAGVCTPECDSMLLGSLIRQLKVVDLLQPRPSRPVHDLSVTMVVEAVANLSSPQWYSLPEVKVKYEIGNAKKKKKAKTKSALGDPLPESQHPVPDSGFFEYNVDSASLETRREGHSCVLDRFVHQVKGIDAGVRGLDLNARDHLKYTKN